MEKSEEQIRFEKEVNDVINGQNNLNAIKICNTPKLLQEIGLEDKPILYSKSHLLKAISLYDKNKHHHGISIQDIYNLPNYIKEPAIILKNYKNKDEPILVFEAINSEKAPIIAIIDINGKGYYEYKEIESNFLLSLYGKENFDNYLSYANINNEIIFYDKKRVQKLETLTTLSLCNCISNIEPNKILQQINEKVNSKIEKNDIKSEEKSMENNNFYEELTDNQKEALKETEEQYIQTYYGQNKEEVNVKDLINFYKNNMLDNDANSFRDKYMREIIEKKEIKNENINNITNDIKEENNIGAKINDLIEELKEGNNKEKVSFNEDLLKGYMNKVNEYPDKILDYIKECVKGYENEEMNNKINEIGNEINKYIDKRDKEILNKYLDLLQNHYAKIDDNKFYEEIDKLTQEEQKELIIKAYKNNNNVNTQEFINVMEHILSQNKVSYLDLKEKYDPNLYKVYDYYDGEDLLYIGYDYEKAKNVAKQQVDDTDGECKVYIDKVDKNLIFHMEKMVDEYYKNLMQDFIKRSKAMQPGSGGFDPHIDNMLKLTNDGKMSALDPRLYDDKIPDEEGTKVNTCIENVVKKYFETMEIKGTQMIFSDIGVPKQGKDFDIYNDIKKKLVKQGIKENEIAFIGDYDTPEKKQQMQKMMNEGKIRILLSSTDKGGTGLNVQEKLCAMHHLSLPWKPSDMEQREGRIIRQGNTFDNVDIYTYIQQGTFDARTFEILENKSNFIRQIMKGDESQRKYDNIGNDESCINYDDWVQMALPDSKIKKMKELEKDIKLLEAERTQFNTRMRENRKVLEEIPKDIELCQNIKENQKKDIERLKSEKDKPFSMKIYGKKINEENIYTEKQDATKRLYERIFNEDENIFYKTTYTKVAEYKGFEICVLYSSFDKTFNFRLKSLESGYLYNCVDLGKSDVGNMIRIENFINDINDERLEQLDRKIEHLLKEQKNLEESLKMVFEKEDLIKEKKAELLKLHQEEEMKKQALENNIEGSEENTYTQNDNKNNSLQL